MNEVNAGQCCERWHGKSNWRENTIVNGWTVYCKLHVQTQCTGCHSWFEIVSQNWRWNGTDWHNSCFRDLSWHAAARTIWSPYLPSNCAATQLLYLIPLRHYANRKIQPLQMPYGPSLLPIPLQGQQDMFSICWMGEPYSTEFHGRVGPQRIRTYAICLVSIYVSKKYGEAIVVCDGYNRVSTKSGEPRGRSVLLWPSQLTWKLPWRRESFYPIQGTSSSW